MLRLHVFGTAHLRRDDHPLEGAASQRRVLAMLAIIASHGSSGVSRDKLLALLWPEGDPDRSRHALTQALYNVRRALGCDDVLSIGSEVRLNPERLSSDLGEFLAAIERRDWALAVALHVGPFLDGFFVTQAPEFERWATAQRHALSLQLCRALEALADEAASRHDARQVVEWRRRRLSVDPLDSTALRQLMLALVDAGDPGSALQQARLHAVRLQEELGSSLPPDVSSLVERLRGGDVPTPRTIPPPPDAVRATASVADRATVPEGVRGAVGVVKGVVDGPLLDPAATVALPSRRARNRWRSVTLAAAAILVMPLVLLSRRGASGTPTKETTAVRLARQSVVVTPFRVTAAEPSLAFLREGMVDLLATRLGVVATSRAVEPAVVLNAWRKAGLSSDADLSSDAAKRLAESLGARMLVTGSVVGTSAHLILTASVLDPHDGGVLFTEQVDGPADSLTVMVDRLATRLIASDAGLREQLAAYRLPPLAAVRAFVDGQAAYRREAYADAVREYERAIDIDSTFALAALRLALASDRLNSAEQHDRALALAWAFRDQLSPVDRAHLKAFAGPRYPDPSNEEEQLRAWNEAATLAQDRSEVWQELGESFFFSGAVIGAMDWRTRAERAFERALSLDPSADGARVLLLMLAARSADTVVLQRYAREDALRGIGERGDFVRWRVATALHDGARLARARDRLPTMSAENLRLVAQSSIFDGVEPDDGERALHILRAQSRRTVELTDAILAQHAFALNQGRPTYALDLTEQLEQVSPASGAHLRLRILDGLYGDGDSTAASLAASVLQGEKPDRWGDTTPDGDARAVANLCVLEQWRIARGDLRQVAGTVATLRTYPTVRRAIPVSTPPRACADLLEALAATRRRSRDALTRVQRLDSLMLTGPAIGDAALYAPLAVARMYDALGEPPRALAAIRRRPYFAGWPRYLATTRREEALLASRVGEVEAARQILDRYFALRRPEGERAERQDATMRALALSLAP